MAASRAHDTSVPLADYFAVPWRHRLVVLTVSLVGLVLGALAGSAVTPSYTSVAQIVVYPVAYDVTGTLTADTMRTMAMATEQQVVTSGEALERSRELGGLTGSVAQIRGHVAVKVPANSLVLQISYTAGSPGAAQTGANAVGRGYLAVRQEQAAARVRSAEEDLRAALATLPRTAPANRRADLQAQLAQLAAVDTTAGVFIDQGGLPAVPSSPGNKLLGTVGLALGLLVGLAAAFVLESSRGRVHGDSDVAMHVGGDVLTVVPALGWAGGRTRLGFLAAGAGTSRTAEALRLLSLRLMHEVAAIPGCRALAVTSAVRADGKSVVAANVASALAHGGRQVVVVSFDRESPLPRLLAGSDGIGITVDVRATRVRFSGMQHASSRWAGGSLTWLRSEADLAAQCETVASGAFADQLATVDEHPDVIVLELPPLLSNAAAARVLDESVAVVGVACRHKTFRSAMRRLRTTVDSFSAHYLGTVLVDARLCRANPEPMPASQVPVPAAARQDNEGAVQSQASAR